MLSGTKGTLFNNTEVVQTSPTIQIHGTDEWSFHTVYDNDHQVMHSIIGSFEMGDFKPSQILGEGFQAVFHLKDLSTLTLDPPHLQEYENQGYRFNVLATCAVKSLLDVLYQAGCIEKSAVNFTVQLGTRYCGVSTGFYLPISYGKNEDWYNKIHEISHSCITRIKAYSNAHTEHPAIISFEFNPGINEPAIREAFKKLFIEKILYLDDPGYRATTIKKR